MNLINFCKRIVRKKHGKKRNKEFGLKQETIDMARQTIVGFDDMSKSDQYDAITNMFKQRLDDSDD